VNVGLWLLLFGVTGPILLFFAYVILSTALLLGSRHALSMTLMTGVTVCAVSLMQSVNLISPALTLSPEIALPFMLTMTVIALGLVAYVARLFSLNLDRFTSESARQSEDLARQRMHISHHDRQLAEEVQTLNEYLTHYLTGQTQTRLPATLEVLAPVQKNLNVLLEHGERLLHAAALVNRLQERISLVKQSLERLIIGDRSAIQVLNSASKTTLDQLSQPLVTLGQQWYELQSLFQRARAEYQSLNSLTTDLAMLRQSLNSANAALSEMMARAMQSTHHLHAMLESDGAGN
jgi:hypothetical protein